MRNILLFNRGILKGTRPVMLYFGPILIFLLGFGALKGVPFIIGENLTNFEALVLALYGGYFLVGTVIDKTARFISRRKITTSR